MLLQMAVLNVVMLINVDMQAVATADIAQSSAIEKQQAQWAAIISDFQRKEQQLQAEAQYAEAKAERLSGKGGGLLDIDDTVERGGARIVCKAACRFVCSRAKLGLFSARAVLMMGAGHRRAGQQGADAV